MKVTFAFLLVALSSVGCKKSDVTQPTAIIYDAWWSSDYAAQSAPIHCPPAGLKWCEDEARADEAEFRGHLSAAFQSDPACSGMLLLIFIDPTASSVSDKETYLKASARPHWGLQVNFIPNLDSGPPALKQPWQLSLDPGNRHYSSGEDDAQGLAHMVCSIARTKGGSVEN